MKTLYLIRHAKSDQTITGSDFDRPLNDRGFKDAPKMAERLLNKKVHPDLIISSPAKRALTTAKTFAETLNYGFKNIYEEKLIYEASTATLLKVINHINDKHEVVLLFGHNPGITFIINYLTNNKLDNLPTCGVFKIEFELDSWKLVSEGAGKAAYLDYPKK
ncbi:SixA phosphatase family protein [Solitalea koreensis]|uniref:Phosphohistidine phosphatase n=1 Tax=Solitalea koreensis TaxID=543615 RepID=A0A521DAS7_9SPHI|nr:histidine phosphatase family protein [Solitalea koreensis]SMO68181.1 phosphohistidine phosphatase [Solitalea koreensis]